MTARRAGRSGDGSFGGSWRLSVRLAATRRRRCELRRLFWRPASAAAQRLSAGNRQAIGVRGRREEKERRGRGESSVSKRLKTMGCHSGHLFLVAPSDWAAWLMCGIGMGGGAKPVPCRDRISDDSQTRFAVARSRTPWVRAWPAADYGPCSFTCPSRLGLRRSAGASGGPSELLRMCRGYQAALFFRLVDRKPRSRRSPGIVDVGGCWAPSVPKAARFGVAACAAEVVWHPLWLAVVARSAVMLAIPAVSAVAAISGSMLCWHCQPLRQPRARSFRNDAQSVNGMAVDENHYWRRPSFVRLDLHRRTSNGARITIVRFSGRGTKIHLRCGGVAAIVVPFDAFIWNSLKRCGVIDGYFDDVGMRRSSVREGCDVVEQNDVNCANQILVSRWNGDAIVVNGRECGSARQAVGLSLAMVPFACSAERYSPGQRRPQKWIITLTITRLRGLDCLSGEVSGDDHVKARQIAFTVFGQATRSMRPVWRHGWRWCALCFLAAGLWLGQSLEAGGWVPGIKPGVGVQIAGKYWWAARPGRLAAPSITVRDAGDGDILRRCSGSSRNRWRGDMRP
ncbi:hypothetical protein NL676_036898 [Syzygium grande]|nr:hypothetical protein NL676_036898 [Syzygium grande]